DFRHRQGRRPKMAREAHERGVFLAVGVFDANGRASVAGPEAEEFPVGTMRQQRNHLARRSAEPLGEEICKTGMHLMHSGQGVQPRRKRLKSSLIEDWTADEKLQPFRAVGPSERVRSL